MQQLCSPKECSQYSDSRGSVGLRLPVAGKKKVYLLVWLWKCDSSTISVSLKLSNTRANEYCQVAQERLSAWREYLNFMNLFLQLANF